MFRRETIIALRARHQAHRIASQILNPPAQVPLPPQPAMPIEPPEDWNAYRNAIRRQTMVLAAIVWGLVALYWLAKWLAKGM
jgi:hypothetical protein